PASPGPIRAQRRSHVIPSGSARTPSWYARYKRSWDDWTLSTSWTVIIEWRPPSATLAGDTVSAPPSHWACCFHNRSSAFSATRDGFREQRDTRPRRSWPLWAVFRECERSGTAIPETTPNRTRSQYGWTTPGTA